MSAVAESPAGEGPPETRSLRARMASGAFWSVTGAILSRGLTLLASIFVARIIGKEQFGALGIVQNTAAMFQVFAGFGLGLTASKYVAELRRIDPVRAGNVLGMATLVAWVSGAMAAITLLICAPWLAGTTLAAPQLTTELRITGILVFLGAVNGAQTGALAGFEAFRPLAVANTLAGLASFPLILAGAWLGGLRGAVWALVATMGINALLNNVVLRRAAADAGVPLRFAGAGKELGVLWRFSLPAVLSGLMVAPVNWVCAAMLVNQPNGFSEMGIYNAANQWRMAILFIPATVAAVGLPLLSNLHSGASVSQYRRVLNWNVGLSFSSAMAVALVVGVFSPWIVQGYGREYVTLQPVLLLLCGGAVISATLGAVGHAIASRGEMWWGLALNSIWAASMVAAAWLLRDRGAAGLALASVIGYGIHLVTVGLFVVLRMNRTFHTDEERSDDVEF